jgi:hypothetical protein
MKSSESGRRGPAAALESTMIEHKPEARSIIVELS